MAVRGERDVCVQQHGGPNWGMGQPGDKVGLVHGYVAVTAPISSNVCSERCPGGSGHEGVAQPSNKIPESNYLWNCRNQESKPNVNSEVWHVLDGFLWSGGGSHTLVK